MEYIDHRGWEDEIGVEKIEGGWKEMSWTESTEVWSADNGEESSGSLECEWISFEQKSRCYNAKQWQDFKLKSKFGMGKFPINFFF